MIDSVVVNIFKKFVFSVFLYLWTLIYLKIVSDMIRGFNILKINI